MECIDKQLLLVVNWLNNAIWKSPVSKTITDARYHFKKHWYLLESVTFKIAVASNSSRKHKALLFFSHTFNFDNHYLWHGKYHGNCEKRCYKAVKTVVALLLNKDKNTVVVCSIWTPSQRHPLWPAFNESKNLMRIFIKLMEFNYHFKVALYGSLQGRTISWIKLFQVNSKNGKVRCSKVKLQLPKM